MSPSTQGTRRPGLTRGIELQEEQVTRTSRRSLRSANAGETSDYRDADNDDDEGEESPIRSRPRVPLALLSPEPSSGSEWNLSDDVSEADKPLVNSDHENVQQDENVHQDDLNDRDEDLEDELADLLHDDDDDDDDEPSRGSQSKPRAKGQTPRHPNAPKISKLQEKLTRKRKAGLNVTDSGRKRGETRIQNGQLQYLLEGEWVKAVHHTNIREYLLRFTDTMGEYAAEPSKGADPWDRTAFQPDHADIQLFPREARPDCLFQWNVPDTLEDSMPEPKLWYHYGHLVLDIDDRPVRAFKELPLTLSGQCEGLRMEFYRRTNPRISGPDFRARMPDRSRCGPRATSKKMKGPALANRMARDRYKIGLRAMYSRNETITKEMAMFEIIPPHIQQEIVHKGTEKSLNKASTRRVTSPERRDRAAKQEKSLLKGKLVTYPVMPELLEQASNRYAPGRRWRKAAASTSNITWPEPSALDYQEAEEGLREEDYDQEESMLATPGRVEEECEESDLPSRGPPRKRRRVSAGEEEERRTAILAHRDNRLGSWVGNSPAPATHHQMPSTRFEHAEEESSGGFHTNFEGYRDGPFDDSTQGYGMYSSAARQPEEPPSHQNFSYWPQIPEAHTGQQAPPLELSEMPSHGFATGEPLVNPFDSFNDTIAELGVSDRQLRGASPMQDLTWTAQTPQMALDDTSVEQSSGLFGEEDMIDWDAYVASQQTSF
ncbi:MAG: hypothetical protein Q9212_005309 [Teloschistes hypoglaucus]